MNEYVEKIRKSKLVKASEGFGNPLVKKATQGVELADRASRQPSRLKEKARRLLKF